MVFVLVVEVAVVDVVDVVAVRYCDVPAALAVLVIVVLMNLVRHDEGIPFKGCLVWLEAEHDEAPDAQPS